VAAGLVFPIVSAHHKYAKKSTNGRWFMEYPKTLRTDNVEKEVCDEVWDTLRGSKFNVSAIGKDSLYYKLIKALFPK